MSALFAVQAKVQNYFKRTPKVKKMAPVNITIRNISNVPLELKLVEHFDPPPQDAVQMANITNAISNITNSIGITMNTTRASVPQISPDAKPFASRELSLAIPPFTMVSTDIKAVIKAPNERFRLTFQTPAGGHHQMYCPVPTTESETLTAPPNAAVRFTGIYLTQHSFVCLYSSTEPNRWMGKLPDEIPLGALSIPGTHNSPTCHNAPPSVRCQAVSPAEQLQNGVRFFDLRVQVPTPYDPNSDALVLVHSVFPISLTGNKYFRDLYKVITDFLQANPSETLILSLKREGTGPGTDAQLSRILKDHYTNPQQWYTQPRVPSLGESRGKIVLLRRFMLDEPLKHEWSGTGWGIDAHIWADNTPCATCPSGDVVVQDFYEVKEPPSIAQKITYAKAQLERSGACAFEVIASAAASATGGGGGGGGGGGQQQQQQQQQQQAGSRKNPLYVNFLSASNFWNVNTWPEKIAAAVNPSVVDHLCREHMLAENGEVRKGDWSTGVVVCDWVGLEGDWDLVRCVVGMNAKLLM